LSTAATVVQFSNYVGVILREVRSVPGAKLAGINIDSAEHGSQNWTADFEAQFEKRRGYSPRKFLPAMMGRVVGSREVSDKFLFDARRTIADLMSNEYFGTFQKLCHAEGITSIAEAPGIATCLPSDNIRAKGRTDIPVGEF
jgi:alpha-L-rhamnosidase